MSTQNSVSTSVQNMANNSTQVINSTGVSGGTGSAGADAAAETKNKIDDLSMNRSNGNY